MKVERCAIADVLLITPDRIVDQRGYLAEAWNRRSLAEAGMWVDFVQENIAASHAPFTVRGLHYQAPPHGQGKLMRVSRGSARYGVVDIRRDAPTYGKSVVVTLDAVRAQQVYTPEGFLHGIVTLEADVEICYKVTAHHSRTHERAVRWDDPDLAIDWGVDPGKAIVSEKDSKSVSFKDLQSPFN